MLGVWLPVSAYLNGISCCTGIVIPCLVSGALIGRLFGLALTVRPNTHAHQAQVPLHRPRVPFKTPRVMLEAP
jgi:hypothetical protein